MAFTRKVLGQSAPLVTTLTDVYTVPAATSAVLSGIKITNRGGAGTTFRVSIAVAGAADATKQYLVYDVNIPANQTDEVGQGVTLGAGDVVRVYAGIATLTFQVFGEEAT